MYTSLTSSLAARQQPPTVAVTTTTAAAAEGTGIGSKPDNNNVASPTTEMEASQGDEATTTGETGATAAAGEVGEASATTASADAEQDPDKDRDKETDKESNKAYIPSPLVTECGSPRKTHSDSSSLAKNLRVTRHSSPLLLASNSGGGVSDGEELPSGSSSSQGSQRKSSVDRQTLIRGRKSIKDLKEVKEAAVKLLEELNVKDATYEMDSEGTITILPEQYVKDQKDTKDTKDTNTKSTVDKDKDLKDSKEKEKETTPTRSATPIPVAIPTPIVQPTPTPTCNRVTRKAHAQELALANNNTRVTRNRRQSSTVNNEPQLPARGRRKRLAPPDPKEFLKRKRSDDDTELGLKYGKLEVKEEEDDHESSMASLGADESTTPAKSTISIKVELPDSEEQITVATAALISPAGAAPAAAVTPTQQSGNRRGRGTACVCCSRQIGNDGIQLEPKGISMVK